MISKEAQELLTKSKSHGLLSNDDFAKFMRNILVSEDGYVIDVGNTEQVNAEIVRRLAVCIEAHPLLWKWFFMVG